MRDGAEQDDAVLVRLWLGRTIGNADAKQFLACSRSCGH